ncbi:MAG TPA: DnaJ domain-containing protein [Acidimicrobiales bacterium]|nr:DnaJ domain-containing protein [Acidimicrobiales bacterium]
MADDWEVLGVRRGATHDEVRARWLALVKELHPDLGRGEPAAVRLAEVNAAYQRLRAATEGGASAPLAAPARGTGAAPAVFAVDDFRPAVFEAVLLAAVDVGDVTRTDEPFSLDMWVGGGSCHVELFPQAGGSVISVDCANVDAGEVAEALAAAIAAQGLGVTVA